MKRIISTVIAITMMFGSAGLPAAKNGGSAVIEASAEETLYTDDWEYWIREEDGTIGISDYIGEATDVVIPNEIDGKKVTFFVINLADNINIRSIFISQYINEFYFWDCGSLENITVDSNNKDFASQDGVVYSKDMTTLIKCPPAKSNIDIPDGVTTLGEEAFNNCKKLTEIALPDSVKLISNGWGYTSSGVFMGCESLESITIPDGSDFVPVSCFNGCKNLKNITLPDSVNWILYSAFNGCESLEYIKVPADYIYPGAFLDCTNLKKIEFTGLPTLSYGDEIFTGCTKLKEVVFTSKVQYDTDEYAEYYQTYPELYHSAFKNLEGDDFKVYCYSGSVAEKYAIDYNINYELLDEETPVIGEITAHGADDLSALTLIATDENGVEYDVTLNPDGSFEIAGLASGKYTITAKMYGYAPKEYEIEVEEDKTVDIEIELFQYGDIDGDGKLTMKDYAKLQQHLNDPELMIMDETADLNGDDKINMKDYALLLQLLNGWDIEFKQ